MPNLSASLDFALSLVALAIAVWCARARNDFLFSGFLWVAAAALVGAFNLGGYTQVDPTHRWLSAVARGPGTMAMGLGVLAAVYGPWRWSRWGAVSLSVLGAALIHLLFDRLGLGALNLLLGSMLLVALVQTVVHTFRAGLISAALAAGAALAILLIAAFGLDRVPLPADGAFKQVDLLHVLLLACYLLIWLAVREVTRPIRFTVE